MAYFHHKHGVGDIVYTYIHATDSVQRLRVTAVYGESANVTRYKSGDFAVSYAVESLDGMQAGQVVRMPESDLHASATDAFPALPEVAA